ncbi:BRO1-domain-containing protein [Phanerochaete sordida]|uniref:BRO1-domain-containing protein n=1 Tax=Phanerochaete sordida TaxID=48140 RepID=A0A9P3G6H2_9APHY|nr:BRO1-domain-containing protein [Phanerochaete sordida]
MPNLLEIPFKKTQDLPICQTVREYILASHSDVHPDAFKWDINQWETLRKQATARVVHVDRVKVLLSYHAQLVFILTKLPLDIGLDIPYTPAFAPDAPPITLRNLAYERAAVLFNLAALYSQLAHKEDRSTAEGLKRMVAFFQSAAGTLSHLSTTAAQKLQASVAEHDFVLEFSPPFLNALEVLMLAQAQEGVWQRAVIDNLKNNVVARLAVKVSSFYRSAGQAIQDAPPAVRQLFPASWLTHMEIKASHFEGVSQFRKSLDDNAAGRYGEEVGRLTVALAIVKRGHDLARRSNVNEAVKQDIKSLLDTVQATLKTSERDNDLIYHQVVPSEASLTPIPEVNMVQPIIPGTLADPKTAIPEDAVIFGELLGHGAKLAIEIYHDRRKHWLQDEITDRAQRLDDESTSVLQSLNLPAALEALERPAGLPPSLLRKAEEVRREDGPARIEASLEAVQKLADRNTALLDEAFDVLDQEAEEDELLQAEGAGLRAPSEAANAALIERAQRYRAILDGGVQSDAVVRDKWDQWERFVAQLTWSNEELAQAIPAASAPVARKGASTTQTHARQLRVLLESLDDVVRARAQAVARATRLAEAEDITPRVLKAAAAIERWVEVQPAMFEDVLDAELAKYEKFRGELEEGADKQARLLNSITERNALFLQSRREDPATKEREHALQSLDLAYHKYKEITRNLDEGLKFYNDIGEILGRLKQDCVEWANNRRDEMHLLLTSLRSMSLDEPTGSPSAPAPEPSVPERDTPSQDTPAESSVPHVRTPKLSPSSAGPAAPPRSPAAQAAPPPPPQGPRPRKIVDLPPPDSAEWEAAELPPPPPSAGKPAAKRAR